MDALSEASLLPDPLQLFAQWFAEQESADNVTFHDAVCLSTVNDQGRPEGRIVLLKGFDAAGFRFFTNSNSRKGQHLAKNPYAAMTFYWDSLGRQIRIEGEVEILPAEESDAYFQTRPKGSRIGAWASEQSAPLESRGALMKRVEELDKQYSDENVPRPPHWNGYRLKPSRFEFWQLGDYRLHDRFQYLRQENGTWIIQRLNP